MASPLRIVYDNAVDRATLTSTGTSVLPITNLKTNSKNDVWRTGATTTSVTLTATFTSPEAIGCVALPFSNLSATATMRVRLYSDMDCTVQLLDSGTIQCAQGSGGRVQGLTAQQSASAYGYGGGSCAAVWVTPTSSVQGVKIDIVDNANLQGYLEAAKLVLGSYYSPDYSVEMGASVYMEDSTEHYRTDAGNLLSDVGYRYKKLSMTLSFMTASDRAGLWKLVKYVGKSTPVFVSLFSGNADKSLEQEYSVFGKFSSLSQIAAVNYLVYSSPLEIESV